MDGFEQRRAERAMRRAERAELAKIARRERIYAMLKEIGAFVVLYGLLWLGCFWASI